jgi:hypothetical protein
MNAYRMREICYTVLLVVLIAGAVLACLMFGVPIPYSAAFTSPLPTLELTPPFRATPTGWPDAPFSWETPRAQKAHSQLARDKVATPANLPTPTLAPLTRIRPRVATTVIERRCWTLWAKHNRD